MSKPNWSDAPAWAQYLAQDEGGEWYWYEHRPIVMHARHEIDYSAVIRKAARRRRESIADGAIHWSLGHLVSGLLKSTKPLAKQLNYPYNSRTSWRTANSVRLERCSACTEHVRQFQKWKLHRSSLFFGSKKMKMSDRELLELAARAAGIEGEYLHSTVAYRGGVVLLGPELKVWNPLEDDGDALRLALKLRIEISPCPEHDSVICEPKGSPDSIITTEALDDFGARRAIVRAAAHIGKAMQEQAK